jgi:hypothetical protein
MGWGKLKKLSELNKKKQQQTKTKHRSKNNKNKLTNILLSARTLVEQVDDGAHVGLLEPWRHEGEEVDQQLGQERPAHRVCQYLRHERAMRHELQPGTRKAGIHAGAKEVEGIAELHVRNQEKAS